MAVQLLVALALLELEDELLLVLELVEDLGGHLLTLEFGWVYRAGGSVVQHQDVKLYLVARLRVELLDVDDVALGNLVLFATGGNDCVHV